MGKRVEILVTTAAAAHFTGGGTNYLVQTPSGVLYFIYVDGNTDVNFARSSDGGVSWQVSLVVPFVGTVTALSVWYDRWSNISAGLIHIAWTESVTDDTLYRTIDTENLDTLSTQTTIFAGTSTAGGGNLSISRAVGGNVYCKTMIDAGAEGGFFRLPNANVPNGAWDAARTIDETMATTDQMILLPDYDAADTQDMLAIFWDASANEVSRKLYDNSANTWSETSIATSMNDGLASTAFPHYAVAMDITNTRHVLVAWNGVDAANADLRCWTVDSGAITAKTDVVTNGTDDQGLCAVGIDTLTGYWWVIYSGKSDGSETWNTAHNLYYKVSQDQGSTWGAETLLTSPVAAPQDVVILDQLRWVCTIPRFVGPLVVAYYEAGSGNRLYINVDRSLPHAGALAGVM